MKTSLAVVSAVATIALVVGTVLVLRSAGGNPVARVRETPIRLTGTINGQPLDEGPERAAEFHALLAGATSPQRGHCVFLGTVVLHYPSGGTREIKVGCCTAWIDEQGWDVGGSVLSEFFKD